MIPHLYLTWLPNEEASIKAAYPTTTFRAFFILILPLETHMASLSTQDPEAVYNRNPSFHNTDNAYLLPNE
jgi:hypothetical protein